GRRRAGSASPATTEHPSRRALRSARHRLPRGHQRMTTLSHETEPKALPHREVIQVMTGLLAGLFTALISNTIVSTALPTIMAALDGRPRQYTWVITTSLLMMTISTPIWGKLSDLFDKKKLVQLTIILFVAGSLVAGLATSISMMMAA